MGREVRRVPPGWEHPRDHKGDLVPLKSEFGYNAEEVAEGLRDGWLSGKPPHYNVGVMPAFPEGSATHYVMYETTTEGTPISPAMPTPEALARWLADNGASAFGGMKASYEAWLRVCNGGYAPSMVMTGGRLMAGVQFDSDG